jgi:formylglycine-generating enzyme required for sulfatase activity
VEAWKAIQNTASVAVLDEFIGQFGNVPVYGALARTRRAELAKVAVVVTPPPQSDAPLTREQERGLKPKESFRECEKCPEMVVVPAGQFTMGSPAEEQGRYDDEGPQHTVTIARQFAVGKFHVTRDQFAAFVQETGRDMSKRSCSWRSHGFEQGGSHPVVCVNWYDANVYAEWVTRKTGKRYRLLSEAEWEYAARGRTAPGAYPRFWFGDNENDLCRYGNGRDQAAGTGGPPCNDGYHYTSPVGHFEANAFGLYDMFGNAWQWTADCYYNSYNGAPADGSVWTSASCGNDRVARGGSWISNSRVLRAASRGRYTEEYGYIGFRVARTLAP